MSGEQRRMGEAQGPGPTAQQEYRMRLCEDYYEEVRRYFARHVGCPEDVEDLVQTALRTSAIEAVRIRGGRAVEVDLDAGSREIVERYLNCYNSKDIERMLELFAEDAVFESVSNTTGVIRTRGKDELRWLALMSVEHFEPRRQTPVT